LNGNVPAYGAKASGAKVQVGKALSLSSDHFSNVVSHRVLVCAPSNQAVDELAWRLHKGALGPSGEMSDFKMVRFGTLIGEERHDGRGKRKNSLPNDGGGGRHNSFRPFSERESYLEKINLDRVLRGVISGRRDYDDFAWREDNNDEKHYSNEKRKSFSGFRNCSHERQKIL